MNDNSPNRFAIKDLIQTYHLAQKAAFDIRRQPLFNRLGESVLAKLEEVQGLPLRRAIGIATHVAIYAFHLGSDYLDEKATQVVQVRLDAFASSNPRSAESMARCLINASAPSSRLRAFACGATARYHGMPNANIPLKPQRPAISSQVLPFVSPGEDVAPRN